MRAVICRVLATGIVFTSAASFAASRGGGGGGGGGSSGGHMFGIGAGVISTEQADMNNLITRANSREAGITTPSMNQAYEGALSFGYRFPGSMLALVVRPSYFYQVANGSGASGSFNYSVTGFTVFPMLRIYPLENDTMAFFLQFGLGYGRGDGKIQEGSAKVDFVGDGFGTNLGFGAAFFLGGGHAITVEANYRYLRYSRNIATDTSGSFSTSSTYPSISQAAKNQEVELDGVDLETRMSGVQYLIGYAVFF